MEPVAVVGFSFELPQEAVDEGSLWHVLENRKNLMTEWPEDRIFIDAFHNAGPKRAHTLPARGAHFMKRDLKEFDAPFFSITTKEAAAMDPQQRWLLEASYHAFENAGISLGSIKGTRMAVFDASTSDDYIWMQSKDPDTSPATRLTSTAASVRPNRLSWYFGLHGPSVHVDTACSSSLVAMDMACKTLHSGDADSALIVASNFILTPESSVGLANQGFLSPDSLSYSFDHRANGFARGEGIVSMIVKPITKALADGDMIRAVIRGTGSNSDGRTFGLTQPSSEAQERLIRQVYRNCGLDLGTTRYFEAHGTGTPVGDPLEAKAIGRTFRASRSSQEPLYIGSIKANIGHLEGVAGLAGMVKAILMVEKGVIPPIALLENLNPDIDAEFYHLKFPTQSVRWPSSGVRRVSVNSFGMGGTNGHVIIDDAWSYLENKGLQGFHQTILPSPMETWDVTPSDTGSSWADGPTTPRSSVTDHILDDRPVSVDVNLASSASASKLLVWSASDAAALQRVTDSIQDYCKSNVFGFGGTIDRLAYTLSNRRTNMTWRTFSIVSSANIEAPLAVRVKPTRAPMQPKGIAFVFTGQGAGYADMGMELMQYSHFRSTLNRVDQVLKEVGASWSVYEGFSNSATINLPEYSQPLCTALQIGLVELLKHFSISPEAVVGHSSGEIGAAYAVGALSLEAAVKTAFYRGKATAALIRKPDSTEGAMISVNLSREESDELIHDLPLPPNTVFVACVNSPSNCTLSGDKSSIEQIKKHLDSEGIFAAMLSTGVAYHSPAMELIASDYKRMLESFLDQPEGQKRRQIRRQKTIMMSSVTGTMITPAELSKPQYWVDNLVSRVNFLDAVLKLVAQGTGGDSDYTRNLMASNIGDCIEIGPHAALRRPLRDILKSQEAASRSDNTAGDIRYHSALIKNKIPSESVMDLVGNLFCHGHNVSILSVNTRAPDSGSSSGSKSAGEEGQLEQLAVESFKSPLPNLPRYPFDHSQKHWHESRQSIQYRKRRPAKPTKDGSTLLLGRQVLDYNPLEPRWRSHISSESLPWIADHVVNRIPVLAGTCILTMAIEAAKQHFESSESKSNARISGYLFKEAKFISPILISKDIHDGTEAILQLRPVQQGRGSNQSDITIFACSNNERWTECFKCTVEVQEEQANPADFNEASERDMAADKLKAQYSDAVKSCTKPIDSAEFYEFAKSTCEIEYRDAFSVLQDIRWNGRESSIARINLAASSKSPQEFALHPLGAVLDAAIHLSFAAKSRGLAFECSTVVLAGVKNTWVSAKAFEAPSEGSEAFARVLHCMDMTSNPEQGGNKGSVFGLDSNGDVLFSMPEIDMSAVSGADQQSAEENGQSGKLLTYDIDWKPQLSLLSSAQLSGLLGTTSTDISNSETFMIDYYPKIEKAMIMATRKALVKPSVVEAVSQQPSSYVQRFVATLRRHYMRDEAANNPENLMTDDELEALLVECESQNPSWGIFPAVARNLESIILGQTDAVDVVFSNGLAEVFYESLFKSACDSRFKSFLELASHENPRMKILEVGAGTGGFTHEVLSVFKQISTQKGATCFSEYTYTDISPGFFENARAKFQDFEGLMNFKKLDLEKDAHVDEGFELESYDLIFAGSVLHATKDLSKTMDNVRKLLKPGGLLVVLEIISQECACGNVGFGIHPGWWLSAEDWRSESPLLTEEQWDKFLRQTGFSGNNVVLRDYVSDVCHIASIIVSNKIADESRPQLEMTNGTIEKTIQPESSRRPIVIADSDVTAQVDLANCLAQQWQDRDMQIQTWAEVVSGGGELPSLSQPDTVLVFLLEVTKPFLAGISEENFRVLQKLVLRNPNILWVTSPGDDKGVLPYFSMAKGFTRTLRYEIASGQMAILNIESLASADSSPPLVAAMESACHIATALREGFASPTSDVEYTVRNGIIETPRLIVETSLNAKVNRKLSPTTRTEPWLPGPALELSVKNPGLLDSLQFIEDHVYTPTSPLKADEVEIEAKAWPLSFRDLLMAMGKMDYETPGLECAGVVTRVGIDVSSGKTENTFRAGDRVIFCMGTSGSMRTYPRANVAQVHRIPDDVSFAAAASTINPAMTAHHALINMGRLTRGEKVLIHSAAGATGQMALLIAKMAGAEIFATVGNEDKKAFLINEFGIEADHIFSSRGTSFSQGIKRMSKGVDVVLNSLSGDSLLASWECLAPYGRFVEIGKADIIGNSKLPMSAFAGNKSFMAVDLHHIFHTNPPLYQSIWLAVEDELARGAVQPPKPLKIYPVSQIEDAFRLMQSGKSTGRVIITADHGDEVQKYIRDPVTWRFDPNASYLLVGGLGGIGRALLFWMADLGAKNFIVLSRSGASSEVASSTIATLRDRGVQVAAPKCDASSKDMLSQTLAVLAEAMPPIKGCINCAMVLKDAIFENMTHEQWSISIQAKATTSWNLHQVLPTGALDFFIMLSSVAGVYGSMSQSNYAAGCTFQDALAYQRKLHGDNAISVDVGRMRTVGIIAETEAYQHNLLSSNGIGSVETEEFLGVMGECCSGEAKKSSQVAMGVVTPAEFLARGEIVPPVLQLPTFSGFAQTTESKASSSQASDGGFAAQFKELSNPKERAGVVVQAIKARFARALGVSAEDIEPSKMLSDLGVDSLMAVELRNWIGKDFQANVAVFDIMGGATLASLGDLVVERSEYKK